MVSGNVSYTKLFPALPPPLRSITLEAQNNYHRKTTSNFHFPSESPQQTHILALGFEEFPSFPLLLAISGFGYDTPSFSLTALKVKGTEREGDSQSDDSFLHLLVFDQMPTDGKR